MIGDGCFNGKEIYIYLKLDSEIRFVGDIVKKILIVVGTRAEAIKMFPLISELKKRDSILIKVCSTGQHNEMLNSVLEVFNVTVDYNLNIMTREQTLFDITAKILINIKKVLDDFHPNIVVVHGDTTTAFSATLAAFYMGIPVAHVEAGLRTNNILEPFPEEYNRKAISLIAKYNFAPTEKAKNNLIREGKSEHDIYVTGNTIIDVLKSTIRCDYYHHELDWAKDSKLILMTVHRRENMGEPMMNIFQAIRQLVEDNNTIKVIFPVHLNPVIQKKAKSILGNHDRIHLVDPLGVIDFHNILNKCSLVITDSGGIQEEASYLKKPILVLRRCSERSEGIDNGQIKLIGTDYYDVINSVNQLLNNPNNDIFTGECPFGDGHACEYIADVLVNN